MAQFVPKELVMGTTSISMQGKRRQGPSRLSSVGSLAVLLISTGLASAQPIGGGVVLPPAPAGVEVTREAGFEFVTVRTQGAVGYPNPTQSWSGPAPWQEYQGRGVAAADFRISRTEITSSQWLTFLQTFSQRQYPADASPTVRQTLQTTFASGPYYWGGTVTGFGPGPLETSWGLDTSRPSAATLPVYGIAWRSAAMYSNWLHNGQSSDWSSLMSGAYDTSTWGMRPNGSYTDALTRQAGARFFIPSLDEWVMAAHYDPNRNGPGNGGFWEYPGSSDAIPQFGLPGQPGAQTSAGIPISFASLQGTALGEIAVGAYPTFQSPWGLLDVAGGAREFTEEFADDVYGPGNELQWRGRVMLGASSGTNFGPDAPPELNNLYAARIFFGQDARVPFPAIVGGIRIAAAVPSPSAAFAAVICVASLSLSRRRS